ncbi:MAG TPA: energy transducer TonB [Vicinamibacteria bacterium]|nr:energy transducer TonB [Vicinamibacteria bacterium]
MAQAQLLPPPVLTPPVKTPKPAPVAFQFRSLTAEGHASLARKRSTTFTLSLVIHSVLVAVVIIAPLLLEDVLPAPSEAVRAFFVTPAQVAPPPPPPPPPPAAGARVGAKAPAAAPLPDPSKFTAPIEIPQEIPPEETLSFGVEGGVAGGVEGGVAGGVVGGIVGGLPQEAPPPPKVVRVGGQLRAPKMVRKVPPIYPPLAQAARLQALVILEAHVDTTGRVRQVKVLRGQPLFEEAAVEAVKQWRYMPLLLNGEPTEFLLTVTVQFNLKTVDTN